jgi:hypothetical protein
MLEKRITRLEEAAPPPPRKPGPSAAAIMLDRVAALKWLSGTRDLTPNERREQDDLWATLKGAPRC